jgi:hypothetical protein
MSNNGMFINKTMHRSRAFRELTTSSILVLFEFLSRRQMEQMGRRKYWTIKNNGEIVLTYAEIRKKFEIARSTIRSSIDQLVKLGFIDIAHHGGGMMKDCSKYGISERWKDYGKDVFIEKSRKKDSRKLGFTKDNWEKQTGRKRKNKSKISTTDNTSKGMKGDTYKYKKPKKPITSGINHATDKTEPNYYIKKGLEMLEAMHPTQYH